MMKFTSNGAVTIAYRTIGSGPPLLLIMGLGSRSEFWFKQIEGLADRFQLILYDNRGCGQTSHSKRPWTMNDNADDAMRVLDAVGVERAHVWGVSMGGMIAQHVALRHEDRVDRLVLAVTTCGPLYAPPEKKVIDSLIHPQGRSLEEMTRDNCVLMCGEDVINTQPELLTELLAITNVHRTSRRGLMFQAMAIAGHNTRHQLKNIWHQTLILGADQDVIAPPENSVMLAHGIENAKLNMLKDAGHGCFLDRPQLVNGIVADFLLN